MEKNNPTLSIIVPVHNVENQLPRCIESILRQTYTDFECLIVNDESTDRSQEIAELYAEKDPRVRLINQKWGGVSKARNNGLKESKGKYIGFVDGDDFIEPDMYRILIEIVEKNNADIGCCNIDYYAEDGTVKPHFFGNLDEVMNDELFMEHVFDRPKTVMGNCFNKIYIKERILEYFDETLGMCEDIDFLMKYCLNVRTAANISKPLYHIYERTNSLSRSGTKDPTEGLNVREQLVSLMGTVNRHLRDVAESDFLDSCLLYDKSYETLRAYIKRNWSQILFNKECKLGLKVRCLLVGMKRY